VPKQCIGRGRFAQALLLVVVGLLLLLDGFRTVAVHVQGPFFDLDGVPGQARLDAAVWVVADKPVSRQEVEASFRIEPPPADCSPCLAIDRDGLAPWSDTTVVFNPSHQSVFAPETDYTVSLMGKRFQFQTIAVPKAVHFSPTVSPASTTAAIEIEFDRPLAENSRHLVTLDPTLPFIPRWQGTKLILEHERLEAGRRYSVTLWPGIRDADGHPTQERFTFTFTTVPPPTVQSWEPSVGPTPASAEVRVAFDRPMDQPSVEGAFRVEPPAGGAFHWLDDRTLVWKPTALSYATTYRISVGGRSQDGDPARPFSWEFRTQDPPRPMIATGDDGTLVLTFDDQGTKAQVEAILDVLKEAQVHAVFFPAGKWAEQNRELMERIEKEGHQLGNHTYSHAHLVRMTADQVRWEIEHGTGSGLLRLPYAERNATVEQVAKELGYQIYGWNVDPQDWRGISAQQIVETVMRQVKPGAVILMHLHGKNTAEALRQLIPALREAGYRFVLPEKPSP
jgi:peptidoglycan/xylan/chitin deacetylase (PgdA/CDA1 family)